MSVLPLKTYAAPGVPLFGTGSGGPQISSFQDLTCSTITVQNCQILFGDGTHLSTIGGQLYFDNELVASQSSISSLSDWSLYPAISTLNMAGNNIQSAGNVDGTFLTINDPTNVAGFSINPRVAAPVLRAAAQGGALMELTADPQTVTLNLTQPSGPKYGEFGIQSSIQGVYMLDQASNLATFRQGLLTAPAVSSATGYISSFAADEITANTLTVQSTIHAISSISSLTIEAESANFSTLWGQPSSFYLDAVSSITASDIICSTLTAANYISTPALLVSSINGSEFTSTGITVQVAGVSSLVSNSISSIGAEIRTALVSTLQFNPSFDPTLDVNLGLGSLFGNLAGAATGAIGVLVGGAALGTGIAALSQARQTRTIGNSTFELVNAATQLQISTVGSVVSSIQRLVSSIDEQTPGEEIFISTIIPAGTPCIRSYSDPLNTVSTPNSTIQYFGQWVALDAVVPPAVSSFGQLFTSSLSASTISYPNGVQWRPGSTFQGTAFVSTLELFWNDASPPLDADLRVGGLVISGSDVGGLNYSKDVLIQNADSGNRLLVYGAAGSGPSTIAYLSDIPSAPAASSTFQQLYTSSMSASTLTMSSDEGAGLYQGNIFLGIQSGAPQLTITGAAGTVNAKGVNTDILGAQTGPVITVSSDLDANGQFIRANSMSTTTLNVGSGGNINVYGGGAIGFDSNPSNSLIQASQINTPLLTTAEVDADIVFGQTANAYISGYSSISGTQGVFHDMRAVSSILSATGNISSLTISTINGVAYPPSISESFSTLTVSTLQSLQSSIYIVNRDLASISLNEAGDINGVATNYVTYQAQGGGGQLAGFTANATGAGSWSNYASGPMYLNASTIRMSTNQVQMESLSTNTINSIPTAAYRTRSGFDNTILWINLSTTVECIASTFITLDVDSYVLAQANTSVVNTTNQFHTSYAFLRIDGLGNSPSTVTTAANNRDSAAGQSISWRQAVSTGTYSVGLYAYADTNGDLQVAQCDVYALGNLA